MDACLSNYDFSVSKTKAKSAFVWILPVPDVAGQTRSALKFMLIYIASVVDLNG